MILDLPPHERPRERLAEKGPGALSSIELIAILLGTGTKNKSALGLASDLLASFTLEKLAEATLSELQSIKGVGLAKAVRLTAAFALWKRFRPSQDRSIIDNPQKAFAEIYPELRDEKSEALFVLLRDVRRGLLHKEVINHPSGDSSPSIADLAMTHKLISAGKLLEIPLVDHLIIGGDTYYSFYEHNIIEQRLY